ncbi:hypothetical protein [uncultured Sphingomonas sp.]|uniref:hypothetical protein n=1 Tax=uncultured Sphingomonas sp. TaxID=158754 RepID=UPI0035C95E4F
MALTILLFATAMIAAVSTIAVTVMPALPKIMSALTGPVAEPILPPLPPRRSALVRASVRPVAGDPSRWRAAA